MRIVLCLPALLLCSITAGGTEIVLDDFSFPGWGLRWSTLEFTKFAPPEMKPGPPGPDGSPSVLAHLPKGGRIVFNTQQDTPAFDRSRGKPNWPLPESLRGLSLRVQPGTAPVSVVFVIRDGTREFRTPAQRAEGAGWHRIKADIPTSAAAMSLLGIDLSRPGEGGDPLPVLIDDLRAEVDGVSTTLEARLALTTHERSPVAGRPVHLFVRLQSTAASAASVPVRVSAARPGSPKCITLLDRTVDLIPGRVAVQPIDFVPPAPGMYRLELTAPDQRYVLDVPVYGRTATEGVRVESFDENVQRIETVRAGIGTFRTYVTNLSPAIAVETQSSRWRLFDGIQAGQSLEPPKYVAVPEVGGVKIYPVSASPSLTRMTESWLSFFAGDAAGWDRIAVISRKQRKAAPLDLPWLVVLQRKPRRVTYGASIELEFGSPAGCITLMPLRGLSTFSPDETLRWARYGLPQAEASHAALWARRLKRFPVHVQEDYRVDAHRDAVAVRQSFKYLELPDEWGTPAEKFAPVPPMLAMAARADLPIAFASVDGRSAALTDGGVLTGVGPASGLSGLDDYIYEIGGVLKYVNEDRLPVLRGGGRWGDKLRAMIREKTPPDDADTLYVEPHTKRSRWSPGLTLREDYGIAMVGNSERQGLLGSTIPYVDAEEALWRKRTLLVDALYLVNPFNTAVVQDARTARLHALEGMASNRFKNWVDNNAYIAEVLRALDYYVQYTGDVEFARRYWPQIRAMFAVVAEFKRHGEWELGAFHAGGGDTWDSVYNGTLGFARLADRVGDGESYRYACYYFAKHAATLPGQRYMNRIVRELPYWASMLADVELTPDRKIAGYCIDVLNWTRAAAGIEDLVFSDVWGMNHGLRGWNQTVWMRGSRSEYRLAKDLVPEYARYWLSERVKKFVPDWYESVLVRRQPAPPSAMDARTGLPVKASEGDYAGKVNLQARAIVLGETANQLWPYIDLKRSGLTAGASDGRVPRIGTLVSLLEDATGQPWVRLFGKSKAAVSSTWERGSDAFLDLGDENYMFGLDVKAAGVRPFWVVFAAPEAQRNLSFGSFGPATGLKEIRRSAVSWNTTVHSAIEENR